MSGEEVSGSPQWKDRDPKETEGAEQESSEQAEVENPEQENEHGEDGSEDEYTESDYSEDELPSAEQQKEAYTTLTNASQMKEGDKWYLIHYRWWTQWKGYTGYKESSYSYYYNSVTSRDDPPGEIDNSALLSTTGDLRRDISETRDFHLVDANQWNLLQRLYGGGPAIERRVIKTAGSYFSRAHFSVEIHLLRLHLVRSSDEKVKVMKLCSKTMTCRELMDLGLAEFGLNEEDTRMYDYHGDSRLKHLSEMDSILSDHQILDNQKIMFDEKDASGKWPAPKQSTSSYYNSYSSYYGSSTSAYSNHYNTGTQQPTTPGKCGLRNLGNTCFMNSAIQCLSNSSGLRQFFLSKEYENDLNRDNPLGTGGELADKFYELLERLWGGEYSIAAPRELKGKIERNASQFSGYNQHDSQELLMYLMDGIHEDCNRVKQKQSVPTLESDGRPDSEVASDAWKGHLKRNDSIVVDLFQGQIKSTLVCPKCNRVSITFDPYMNLSVPIAVPKNRTLKIIMNWADPLRNPMKMKVDVPKAGKISDLKAELSKLVDLPEKELFVTEVYNCRFYKEFCDNESLSPIRETDKIHVHQIPPQPPKEEGDEEEEEEEAPKTTTTTTSSYYGSSYGGSYGGSYMGNSMYGGGGYGGSHYSRPKKFPTGKPGKILHVRILNRRLNPPTQLFGKPVVVSVPREVTYQELLRKIVLRLQKHLDMDDPRVKAILENTTATNAKPQEAASTEEMDVDKSDEDDKYDVDDNDYDEDCLFRMAVTNDMGSSEKKVLKASETGPILDPFKKDAAIFVTLGWSSSSFDSFKESTTYDEHESYNPPEKQGEALSVTSCLDTFSKPETLSPEDSWYCNKCKEHVEASKQVELFSVPENIIIHLKRFSYSTREKLGMLIDFPIEGLDLKDYLVNKSPKNEPIYDLYAVVNHFGSMGGGHYTAYAKHGPSGEWYHYDDSNVSKTTTESLVSESAYVLFYKRRDTWENDAQVGNENLMDEGGNEEEKEEGKEDEAEGTEEDNEPEIEEEKGGEEEETSNAGEDEDVGMSGEDSTYDSNQNWQEVETGLFK